MNASPSAQSVSRRQRQRLVLMYGAGLDVVLLLSVIQVALSPQGTWRASAWPPRCWAC